MILATMNIAAITYYPTSKVTEEFVASTSSVIRGASAFNASDVSHLVWAYVNFGFKNSKVAKKTYAMAASR